jgi:hypothetical protein
MDANYCIAEGSVIAKVVTVHDKKTVQLKGIKFLDKDDKVLASNGIEAGDEENTEKNIKQVIPIKAAQKIVGVSYLSEKGGLVYSL